MKKILMRLEHLSNVYKFLFSVKRISVSIQAGLLVLLTFSFAHAQIYKWVDEHGKIQYSDRPPPPGMAREEKTINVKTGVSAHSDLETKEGGDLADQKLEFEKRRQQRLEQETNQQTVVDENKKKCIDAKTQLSLYADSPRLTVPDGSGGITYVDDETRQKKIDEANKLIATFCK
ncbi:MAG: DUF4124 domain-containing protein [Nitrosomonas sp.]|nr:MAG: DUF4124 domain-containing protein [Nitrosomonas sp.]